MSKFGKKYKEIRLRNNLALRDFCRKHGIDASNLSKMERGVLSPPIGYTLDRYIEVLGIEKNSEEWFEMNDLAALDRGTLPKYIVDDAFLLDRMPIFFNASRKCRSSKDIEEFMEHFKNIIMEAWT